MHSKAARYLLVRDWSAMKPLGALWLGAMPVKVKVDMIFALRGSLTPLQSVSFCPFPCKNGEGPPKTKTS